MTSSQPKLSDFPPSSTTHKSVIHAVKNPSFEYMETIFKNIFRLFEFSETKIEKNATGFDDSKLPSPSQIGEAIQLKPDHGEDETMRKRLSLSRRLIRYSLVPL
jgi:hypothetical protein